MTRMNARLLRGACVLAAFAALVLAAGAHARESFTIAVIPDTQNYVDETRPQPASLRTFKAEMQWLADHRVALNLAFVTHVGDVVEHGDGTNGRPGDASYGAGAEWRRAAEAMDILAATGVPFGMSPGNHDYDNRDHAVNRPLAGSATWVKFFGSRSRYFAGKPWYGGGSDALAHNPGLSSYQTFSALGRNFLHISLELEASDAAVAWAQAVIDRHPGYATIVTTHEFIEPPLEADDSPPLEVTANRVATAVYLKGSPGGWNDAQRIWEKLIAKDDQIFMVVCGHAWRPAVRGVSKSENVRIGMNEAGHPVYQLLS
jgi:Calcineurin-like phosphoesterase